jgi:tRNA G18 (ribose-2'-O)-methylase SpoU|tara:strand:- start:2990 stop:3394 length:405 start_codon:yes stop_codon:yes gene_type:complete
VGSFFRTCDAFGVSKLILTGYTATPPRREISKTAIGAEEWIPWEHHKDPLEVITQLKQEGWGIVGLEITDNAQGINNYNAPDKVCLIVGHEVKGVPKEVLEKCDEVVSIPMKGKKESLNVSVAAGVALNKITNP